MKEKIIKVKIEVPDRIHNNGEQMEILNKCKLIIKIIYFYFIYFYILATNKDSLKQMCINTLLKFVNSKNANSIDVANLLMSIFKLDSLIKMNCVYYFVKISNIIMNDGFLMLNEE